MHLYLRLVPWWEKAVLVSNEVSANAILANILIHYIR